MRCVEPEAIRRRRVVEDEHRRLVRPPREPVEAPLLRPCHHGAAVLLDLLDEAVDGPVSEIPAHPQCRRRVLAVIQVIHLDGPGPAERVQDWLLGLTATNERFRGRLLRYLDVLASVDHDSSGAEAKRLAAEYFGDEFPELPRGAALAAASGPRRTRTGAGHGRDLAPRG